MNFAIRSLSGAIRISFPLPTNALTAWASSVRIFRSMAPASRSAIRPIHRSRVSCGVTYMINEPAALSLFSPAEVKQLAPQLVPLLPKSFSTLNDILKLPLKNFSFSVGDTRQPPPFQLENANHDNTFHFYWQDTWKVKPSFTLTYGLGWNYESNALNHDITKPQWLAP